MGTLGPGHHGFRACRIGARGRAVLCARDDDPRQHPAASTEHRSAGLRPGWLAKALGLRPPREPNGMLRRRRPVFLHLQGDRDNARDAIRMRGGPDRCCRQAGDAHVPLQAVA